MSRHRGASRPAGPSTWIYRRAPTLRRPYAQIVERTADAVPYLAPEIALLFKAKDARPKDEADLRLVLPALDRARRAWLASALARAHPGHHRLDGVGEPTAGG